MTNPFWGSELVEVKCLSDATNAAYMIGEKLSSGEFHPPAVNHRTTPDNVCNTFIFLTSCNCLRIEHCLKVKVLPKINTAFLLRPESLALHSLQCFYNLVLLYYFNSYYINSICLSVCKYTFFCILWLRYSKAFGYFGNPFSF